MGNVDHPPFLLCVQYLQFLSLSVILRELSRNSRIPALPDKVSVHSKNESRSLTRRSLSFFFLATYLGFFQLQYQIFLSKILTEKERILLFIYRGFGDRIRSYQEVADLFNATHPDCNPISKSTVCRSRNS